MKKKYEETFISLFLYQTMNTNVHIDVANDLDLDHLPPDVDVLHVYTLLF